MMIADMHCDTLSFLETGQCDKQALNGERGALPGDTLRKNSGQLDLERMKQSNYLLQNFALFVDMGKCSDPWKKALSLEKRFQDEMAQNADMISCVYSYRDIENAMKEHRMCAMLTAEEGGICAGKTERLHELYCMGVRMMTLTWNYPNELGEPAYYEDNADEISNVYGQEATQEKTFCTKYESNLSAGNGLTQTGIYFVEEMERLGIIPDVSHLSDAGIKDVLHVSKKPIVASHSNARNICDQPRNLPDELIRAIADQGGCIGLNYYTQFLGGETKKEIAEKLVAHAKHLMNIGGLGVLGLGSDFDGMRQNPLLKGAESMGILWDILHDAGFTEDQLDRIFYKNVLRLYRDCL